MNLKAAASVLGVHYQTVYRYVRSGELVAVRMGAGYEVSEAAVELFMLRHRAGPPDQPVPIRNTNVAVTPRATADVREELRLVLASTTLSAGPAFDVVTRFLAETVGDACVLRLLSEDGDWLASASSYHVDPGRRATLAAFAESRMVSVGEATVVDVVRTGRIVRVDFNRQDTARLTIPKEFQQYADELTVAGYIVAPILSLNGRVLGVLSVSRESPGRPFVPPDEELIIEMAEWSAAALGRAGRFSAGWFARRSLHESVEALFIACPDTPLTDVTDVLLDLLDDEIPEAIFSVDGSLVAFNDPFAARLGLDPILLDAVGLAAAPEVGCTRVPDRELWQRLIAGETDFLDDLSSNCADVRAVVAGIHWGVARRPDASPAFVICTCDPMSEGVDGGQGARCWALCRVSVRPSIKNG